MSKEFRRTFDDFVRQASVEFLASLPPEDRAAPPGESMCLATHNHLKCTKIKGHTGEHIAHGSLKVLERWGP